MKIKSELRKQDRVSVKPRLIFGNYFGIIEDDGKKYLDLLYFIFWGEREGKKNCVF